MPSRRRALALLGAAFGGCLGRDTGTATESPPTTRRSGDGPTPVPPPDGTDTTPDRSTPEGWPPDEWTPDWRHGVGRANVLGIDPADEGLFVLASDGRGPTTLSLFDPDSRSTVWAADLAGKAVPNSQFDASEATRGWGVTLTDDVVLVVTGEEGDWTALHALDRASGATRWSLRRDRRIAVRGVTDGAVHAVAREFETRDTDEPTPRTGPTPTPEPLPATVLSVARADGSVRWERDYTGVGDVAGDASGVSVGVMDELVALSPDGEERWRVGAGARVSVVVPGDNVVYAVARPEWNRSVVTGVGTDGDSRWRRRYPADVAVGVDGSLLLAGDGSWLVGADGTPAWHRLANASRPVFSPDGGTVYFRTGRMADAVDSASMTDGTGNWRFDPPISNAWPEAASAGALVAGGIGDVNGGVGQPLYRVDAGSGEATGRYLGEDPLALAVAGDAAFAGTGDYEAGGELLSFPL